MWGWNPDPDPDFILSVFTSDQCMNWSDGCYSDPEVDRMYLEQQLASDLADRERIVAEMQEFLYEDVAQVILYYESDLEAYRTDTFTNWVATPEPDGYFVFGYVPYGYTNVRPVIADDGSQVTNATNTIPLWVWGAGVAVLVGVALGIGALRRRGEDERT
jgi:peptide/nickel transport system substrate-binding protein